MSKKEKTVYVGCQVPVSIRVLLTQLAVKEDKSLSAVVRTALCEYMLKMNKSTKGES